MWVLDCRVGWLVGLIRDHWLGLFLVWVLDCRVFSRFQCLGLLGLIGLRWVCWVRVAGSSNNVLSLKLTLSLDCLVDGGGFDFLISGGASWVFLGLRKWGF